MMPVYGERALEIGDALVIADLHIGIEKELGDRGIKVPRQTPGMEGRIKALLEETGAQTLVILGDLKHNIPSISWGEYRDIPPFIEALAELAEVVLVKGNHDGDMEKVVQDLIVVSSLEIGDILLTHGHMKVDDLDQEAVIMGHNHPSIAFRDEFGKTIKETAWIRGRLKEDVRGEQGLAHDPEIVIMPAFNELLPETGINFSKELLGPLFRQGLVDVDNAEAFLLDGTALGSLEDLRPG